MGAGVGRRLTENKVTVLTSLAGRSGQATRAREAGMQPVEERALTEADFLLSIVPPGEALALASGWRRCWPPPTTSRFMSNATRSVRRRCNNRRCDRRDRRAFVGAGIIGPPPKPGSSNTKIYVSGPARAKSSRGSTTTA